MSRDKHGNNKRNALCHCGSKLKFKKCCLIKKRKKEAMEQEAKGNIQLSNSFRDEAAAEVNPIEQLERERREVGNEEIIRRNMIIGARQLQMQRDMQLKDLKHNTEARDEYIVFIEEIAALPICDAKLAIITRIMEQINALDKHIKQSEFGSQNEATLAAFLIAIESYRESQSTVDAPAIGGAAGFDDTPPELQDDDDSPKQKDVLKDEGDPEYDDDELGEDDTI